jgi:hypothetical protein
MDEELLDNVFQTAARYSQDSLLTEIYPELMTVVHFRMVNICIAQRVGNISSSQNPSTPYSISQ